MKDYRLFNDFVNKTTRMGAIILGSGTISRHIMRMGQNRGGFDYGLIINTELDIDQPE
jgi:deoxyhypusine synthase